MLGIWKGDPACLTRWNGSEGISERQREQGDGCVICMIKRPENGQERALSSRGKSLTSGVPNAAQNGSQAGCDRADHRGKTACKQDVEGARKVRKMKKSAACMRQTEQNIKKYRQLFSSCR